jgi:flagellar biosynthesis/type III secretory pathway chaperone
MRSEDNYLLEIEGELVSEFRVCQSLFQCMKEERKSLSAPDIGSLFLLIEKREEILEQLDQLEMRRLELIHEFAETLDLDLPSPRLSDCLSPLEKPTIEHIRRLCEGIAALQDSLCRLGEWNRALANSVLNRDEMIEAFLLNLYPPAHHYRPPV